MRIIWYNNYTELSWWDLKRFPHIINLHHGLITMNYTTPNDTRRLHTVIQAYYQRISIIVTYGIIDSTARPSALESLWCVREQCMHTILHYYTFHQMMHMLETQYKLLLYILRFTLKMSFFRMSGYLRSAPNGFLLRFLSGVWTSILRTYFALHYRHTKIFKIVRSIG